MDLKTRRKWNKGEQEDGKNNDKKIIKEFEIDF